MLTNSPYILEGDLPGVAQLRRVDIPAERCAVILTAQTFQETHLVRRIQLALTVLDGVPNEQLAEWAKRGVRPTE